MDMFLHLSMAEIHEKSKPLLYLSEMQSIRLLKT